jgi:hypothetical protein
MRSNARVQDALPAALAGFGWTCTASGAGASCATPAGSGDIDALVTLPVGNERDVHGERHGAGRDHGALINTATVTRRRA